MTANEVSWSKALKVWIDRFREAQTALREVEDEHQQVLGLIEDILAIEGASAEDKLASIAAAVQAVREN